MTPLYAGFFDVNRYEIEVERHDGGVQTLVRDVMERGDSVAVLGYDASRDEVVLVNEFRPGILVAGDYPFTDNLAAGVIAKGESPLDAAVREIKEETGLELRDPRVIHPGAYVSSGGTSERIVIVFGSVDTGGAGGVHGNPDEQEDILTVVLPADEFIDRARRGDITDLKTLVAAYWLAQHRQERAARTSSSR
ncbi:MAG TPA: NUDIX domain-containing protein [Gammaproteobacteria bacterium]